MIILQSQYIVYLHGKLNNFDYLFVIRACRIHKISRDTQKGITTFNYK